ncbi:hemin-degrading factor [Chryseobacterium sp. HSC-36S06]|uniref:hemin-degrading factor n=1 Tax=Chryseobacterium sp. HSC-36S06 TaxID=2910970 RepID=UPI001A1A9C6B|nr:hemin-degrading factor [Chryseobacterium sp. HSC-36S06]MBH1959364.1 hypothetical protein [Flavobacteriia bacterium]MBH2022927.1 hypothetical protein [Flavobacteriales bacterium]MCP2038103.1 hypothetical protein [Chryseobacterium sp. HSC-36S06]
MKKVLLVGALALFATVNAQTQNPALAKGKWLVEANTNFGVLSPSSTSIGFYTNDGDSMFKIGGEAGYFVANNLALKVGLGVTSLTMDTFYGDNETSTAFNYKIGAKYYIASMFPVQIDFNGISSEGENINAVGFQGGYAWFVSPNISIEPGLRYDLGTAEGSTGIFSGNVGFALHF